MKHPILKNLIIIASTVVATIFTIWVIHLYDYRYSSIYSDFMNDIDVTDIDTTTVSTNDIQLQTDTTLTVSDIFDQYLQNKLAFNKKNEGKSFEFVGIVTEIGSSIMDCSLINFVIEEQSGYKAGEINCLNCVDGVDKWKEDLLTLKKGDRVKVKGYYTTALAANTLTFRRCKLIR